MVTKELVTIEKAAQLFNEWNYEESVAKVKVLVYRWENVTQEIIDELWIAREKLSTPAWNKKSDGTNVPSWADYCKAIGVTKRTVNRWLELPHVAHNTGEDEWFTPSKFIEAARQVMGSIDTDPASTDKANEIVKATTYFAKQDDGRKQEWGGNIWLNPPYKQPLVSQFCNLLVSRYSNNGVKQACVLVNNATETAFYQEMLKVCSAVCFIKGRVKFLSNSGAEGAPLQGQTILYFGGDIDKFTKHFEKFGVVLYAEAER